MSTSTDTVTGSFGLWDVQDAVPFKKGPHRFVPAICRCGTRRDVNLADLRSGRSKNCGCVRREKVAARNYKHGMGNTRLHARWLGMIARCYDKKHKGYRNYGGRGITVCQRWRDSFEAFLEDMGLPPNPQHKIDRINNDGNYEPGNCRWATNVESARNGRHNRFWEHNGQRKTVAEWAEQLGIEYHTLLYRVTRYGWSVERALATPTLSHSEAARLTPIKRG